MGKVYSEIDTTIREWIARQKVFFVSTAPINKGGYINCSPKGLDTLRVIGPRTIAYLDLTGSGVETIAHLKENGRIVIMLCAFEGLPKIFRFHGTGTVVQPRDQEFPELMSHFDEIPGIRAIITVDVQRISDSCGFGVPLFEFQSHRDTLVKWSKQKGAEGLSEYRIEKNTVSINGLPGVSDDEQSTSGPINLR